MDFLSGLLQVVALTVPSYQSVIEEEAAFAKAAIDAGVIPALGDTVDLLSAYVLLGTPIRNSDPRAEYQNGVDVGGVRGDAISDRRATLRDISAGHVVNLSWATACIGYYEAVLTGLQMARDKELEESPDSLPSDSYVQILIRVRREMKELNILLKEV